MTRQYFLSRTCYNFLCCLGPVTFLSFNFLISKWVGGGGHMRWDEITGSKGFSTQGGRFSMVIQCLQLPYTCFSWVLTANKRYSPCKVLVKRAGSGWRVFCLQSQGPVYLRDTYGCRGSLSSAGSKVRPYSPLPDTWV